MNEGFKRDTPAESIHALDFLIAIAARDTLRSQYSHVSQASIEQRKRELEGLVTIVRARIVSDAPSEIYAQGPQEVFKRFLPFVYEELEKYGVAETHVPNTFEPRTESPLKEHLARLMVMQAWAEISGRAMVSH